MYIYASVMLGPRIVFISLMTLLDISVNGRLVTTDQGTLNGTFLKARNGKLFNAFYGIPFGKPPIGALRFKAPVAADPWEGILDTTRTPIGCPELSDYSNASKGSEDCLNLNVYSPLNAQKGDNLSVLFYIHGGEFKFQDNMEFGPHYMMTENLIIVIPNYRCGALGFLSTGDTVIPGNFGLKDQLLALKWTRQNINNFGGDPNQITLQGHSSGAMSVHLHTISPASKGLFQRVIIQSGSAFGSLAYWRPDVANAISKEFALRAGCSSVASSKVMYECFMSLPVDILVSAAEDLYAWDIFPITAFVPTIEDERVENAFLTDIPNNLPYHSPQLPWLIGLTTGEGAPVVAEFLTNDGEKAALLDEFYETLFPITLHYLWNTDEKYLNNISQSIRNRYFGEKEIGLQTSRELVEMYSDAGFGFCVLDAIHTYPGPKYVYWYDYVANYSCQNDFAFFDGFLGVSHADEINLLFRTEESVNVLSNQDVIFSKELVKRWANFIQSSDPNSPEEINTDLMEYWEPMTSQKIEYLLIKINGTMETDLYKEAYPFWKHLPIGSKYEICRNTEYPDFFMQDRNHFRPFFLSTLHATDKRRKLPLNKNFPSP